MTTRKITGLLSALLLLIVISVNACGGDDESAGDRQQPTPTAVAVQPRDVEPTAPDEEAAPTETRGSTIGDPAERLTADARFHQPTKRPLAIMIENHPYSRPQSGLDVADVVYEAPAEYGIPRFLAIYVNREAPVLGPVRSARAYFVAWASEYKPLYMHAGGSPTGLSWIKQLKVQSVDALRTNIGGFGRTDDREAPHNLYADTRALRKEIKKDESFSTEKGTWGGLQFSDKPTVGSAEGQKVRVEYESGYNVSYEYDERTGVYNRIMLGKPHLDRESKKQLSGAVVIVQTVKARAIEGDALNRLDIDVQDKQPTLVFQDGRVIEGFWEKEKRDSPTKYTTKDGQSITLKPGRVWIQIVPKDGSKIER
jgi:hypothetical protein